MQNSEGKPKRAGAPASALLLAAGLLMSAHASAGERLMGRTWLAEDIQGGGVVDRVQSLLSFEPGGRVTGSGGCNRLFGSAKVEGESLSFGGIGTSRMACVPSVMQQEQRFLRALAATRAFGFTGAHLRFYDAAGAELVRFAERR
jgi:putative lipoprotein